MKRSKLLTNGLALLVFILVNVGASLIYSRIDLTEDKRYTLSEQASEAVSVFNSPVITKIIIFYNSSQVGCVSVLNISK